VSDVIGMHFVRRGDENVVDHGDGTFDTGFWKVDAPHCGRLRYVALHQAKAEGSYRQGTVLRWRWVPYEEHRRVVSTVRDDGRSRAWVGGGSGEKGYARR
jgi:hypothetical protein